MFADSAAVWLQGNAGSSWHAASALPATARSKQPDRCQSPLPLFALPPISRGRHGGRGVDSAAGTSLYLGGCQLGAWRRWLSRRPVKPEAAGSSPVAPVQLPGSPFVKDLRAVAQWLARSVRDREVGSSSLPSPTVFYLRLGAALFAHPDRILAEGIAARSRVVCSPVGSLLKALRLGAAAVPCLTRRWWLAVHRASVFLAADWRERAAAPPVSVSRIRH